MGLFGLPGCRQRRATSASELVDRAVDSLAISGRPLSLAYTGLEVLLRERSTRTLLYAEELCRTAATSRALWRENFWQVIECQTFWWRLAEHQWDLGRLQEDERALESISWLGGEVGKKARAYEERREAREELALQAEEK